MTLAAAPGAGPESTERRGWPRALALLAVAMATAVVQPSVLVAVPLLALGAAFGVRRWGLVAATALAVLAVAGGGERDGLWYVERGWALLVGGWFAALTLRDPSAPFSRRALGAVGGGAAAAALLLRWRSGAWSSVEWAVEDRLGRGLATALQGVRLLRGGEGLTPGLESAVYETVQAQATVFPALLGISSLAALGVAWWTFVRLAWGSDQGLGTLRDFRFNDHLVWLFIAGVIILVTPWEEVMTRVGANAVVFMGALYAVRGAAVVLFLSGGLSIFSYVMLGLGLVFLPPLVLTGALVIGLGDTWLDVRRRGRRKAT